MGKLSEKKTIKKMMRSLSDSRNRTVGFLATLVTLVLCFAIIAGLATPNREGISVGELATDTITAPRDITDTVTTQQFKDLAADAVAPVYVESPEKRTETLSEISLFYSRLENARSYAEETYIRVYNEKTSKRNQISEMNMLPQNVDWASVLSESDRQTICSLATTNYTLENAVDIASLSASEIETAAQKTELILSYHAFSQDVLLSEAAYKEAVKNALTVNYFFSDNLLKFANLAIDQFVTPYIWEDTAETLRLKEAAVLSVEPVVYKQGQNIAVKGEVITNAQYEMLKTLNMVDTRPISVILYASLFVILALLFFGYFLMMSIFELSEFSRIKQSLMIALIMVMAVAVIALSEQFDTDVMVIVFATIMCTVLIDRRTALSFNVLLSLVFAVVVLWKKGQISAGDFERILLVFTTGASIPLFLKNTSNRSSIIQASVGAGLVGVVTLVTLGVLRANNWHDIVMRSLWCLLSCPINGIFAIGLLPLWEMVFGMATQTKLLELSNMNRKLLQRLMQEAPGTYYHSSMVANLAERAAEALGANALLVRAAALYHDIGKLDNPQYFTENMAEENPHEKLGSLESAKIIVGHVAASVRITKADNIPKDVIEIISQHHGDALIPNFYYKEKEKNPKVDEELFRYPFSKPTTKEAGILMIADTVEAAMRSASELSPEERQDKINALVVEKLNFGLLDDCPLTRKELGICARIFALSLRNAHHKRVKYRYNLSGQVQE